MTEEFNPWEIKVIRTYDRFETSQQITDNYFPPYQYQFILRDIISGNGSIIGIGYNAHGGGAQYNSYYRLAYSNGNLFPSHGTENTQWRLLYGTFVNSDLRYLGVQSDINNFPGTRFYSDLSPGSSILIDEQTSSNNVGGISFSSSKGFVTLNDKVYVTTNSGNNWTQEATLNSTVYSNTGHHRVKSFGDVCYAGTSGGKFHTRLLNTNLRTVNDWQLSTDAGSFIVDGQPYTTNSNQNLRGGTFTLSTNGNRYILSGTDTVKRFYYWGGTGGSASMGYSNSQYYGDNSGLNIDAVYKTKLISTSPEALKNANQTRSFKDVNGRTHLIYESMGGIFYTSTKDPQNLLFRNEEILSGTGNQYYASYATFNNSNPFISESLPFAVGGNYIHPEANVVAIWERREGNNIKIIATQRTSAIGNQNHWVYPIDIATIPNVTDPNFKAFPKIFQVEQIVGGVAKAWGMITYLVPNGSTNKDLIVKVYRQSIFGAQPYNILSNVNIAEYSVASNYISPHGHWLHIAYRVGNNILYRNVEMDYDYNFPNPSYTIEAVSTEIGPKFSPDISLRNSSNIPSSLNVQPVVTYQGQQEIRIEIQYDNGPPILVTGTYYPIYVRERLPSGAWNDSYISYNSLNITQQYPNIEGSKNYELIYAELQIWFFSI